MDVKLPNGVIIRNVPDGMSKADLAAKLRAAGHDMSWLDAPAPAAVADPVADPADAETVIVGGKGGAIKTTRGALNEALDSAANIPKLVGRSTARLGEAATELPGVAARVLGGIPGAIADLPSDLYHGVVDDSALVRDIKRMKGEEVAPPRERFTTKTADVASDLARPITESRPVRATREWFQDKEKQAVDALTPEARAALQLSLVESEEDGLHVGEGATDPWWWTANVIDVGVQAAPGMGVTGLSARMAYAAKYRQVLGELGAKKIPQSVALKAAEKQALQAAKRAAVVSGGLTEGATGGGQDASDVRSTIDSLDEETLMGYPGYLELREAGLTHEQARERVASDKAAATAISAGAVIGLTGAPMNAFFGSLTAKLGREVSTARTLGQRAAAVGEAAAGEGAQEFVQEGAEQAIQNQQLAPITKAGTWDHVLENAITGGVLGAVVGAGMASPTLRADKKAAAKPNETPPPVGPADPVASAASAYDAATAALRKGMETARDPAVRMKYADLQALKDKHREAMVNYTRELMHAGMIDEKQQPAVADALKQAEAAGVSATPGKPAGGDISSARDAALEAVANAQELEEVDANDLIAKGLAKANSMGAMVLTPAGRRERKAAQERAKAEESSQAATKTATESAVKPAPKLVKPKLTVPAAKQTVAQKRAAERKAQKSKPARELAAARAAEAQKEADYLPAAIQARAQDEAANPQMKAAFAGALDRARRARAGLPARGNAAFRLKGAPAEVEIPGQGKVKVEPVPAAKQAAAEYRKAKGITAPEQTEFVRVDPKRAKRIAAAFEQMKHAPNDPVVKRAYRAMIDETKAQWDQIKKTGLKVEFIKPGQDDPYAKSPRLAIEDVRKNNHLWVFPTDSGFGSDDKFAKDNPMLEDAGESVGGHKLKNNDVFRIVHDYFGHVAEANGFRADGEENAWRIHAAMYSPLARRAMTTETRGQNSWVNYGPHGEKNRTASAGETTYAPQKIGLLPAEFSSFPGKTLKFKHFSSATEDQINLDPERMGTGAKGAEAKRGGPKVTSLYAEHGETEPDVANGRNRYNVEIPEEDLYNGSSDPAGLLRAAQVPYGMTTDAQGNTVPVGTRFDMNKFEELVRDAGYTGYHLPEAQGILKGQARIFHPYPATREGTQQLDIAMRRKLTQEEKVRGLLTPAENERLKKASARKLIEVFDELPSGAELAASALAGQAKRGWYERSAKALVNVYGPDAPRFAALLAALSPQIGVEQNFRNAVSVWQEWEKLRRPTTRDGIKLALRNGVFPGSQNKVGSKSPVLPAWINNSVRALTAEDPSSVVLSGPKVDSFAANLRGETERVTLDAWMANWAGVNQTLFRGAINVDETSPGLRPGYLAYSARVREAARLLSERTGETWTPAEVQETVWSWAKTLYEQAESFGALATARELVDNQELTDELINATPDFAGLFADPEVSSLLAGTVYGDRAARNDAAVGSRRAAGKASAPSAQDQRHLRKAADRLDALRKARQESEAETRAEVAMAVKAQTETPEFKAWFGGSKVVNPDGTPMVVYHGTNWDFSEFETGKRTAEGAAFFTPNAELATTFGEIAEANSGEGAASTLPVYLSIKNPLVVDANDVMDHVSTSSDGTPYLVHSFAKMQAVVRRARRLGYDGLHLRNIPEGEFEADQWAAFHKTQIKSAIGNRGTFDPNNPDIVARMGSRPDVGMPRRDLDAVVQRLNAELGVPSTAVDSITDLPADVQEIIPDGADPTGLFVTDPATGESSIYLVRENLDSTREAYETALHEAVGHKGLRALLGANYHKVMEQVRASFPEKVQWAAKQNLIDMEHPDPATRRRLQSLATEELIAYAAGQVLSKRGALSKQSVWRRIVAKVREILRGIGVLNNWSGEEIEALIYRARDFFRKSAKARAEEIKYRGEMAMRAKQQADDAPQWLSPEEYLAGAPVEFPTFKEQITFSPGFNETLRGEEIDGADLNFGEVSAFADGQKIGYVTIAPADVDSNGWTATYVHVNPRYRGKGVAQRMYKAVSDRLGVKPRPSNVRSPAGRNMWASFERRNVAFRMKPVQTRTKAFKEWFGTSKIKNEDGTPKRLYHGTFGDFDAFNTSKANPESYVGPGVYFTDDPDDASEDGADISYRVGQAYSDETEKLGYQMAMQSLIDRRAEIDRQLNEADRAGNYKQVRLKLAEEMRQLNQEEIELGDRTTAAARKAVGHVNDGAVIPVFMRMETPFRIGGNEEFEVYAEDAEGIDEIKVALREQGFEKAAKQVDGRIDVSGSITGSQLLDILNGTEEYAMIPQILQRLGYDGIIDEGVNRWSFTPYGATHYITWRSENVKSAVGNNGNFDRNDPRVAFAFKQGPTGNSDLDSFISKIGASPKTFRQRWDEFKADLKDRAIMGLFDEFHGIFRAGELAGITAADSGYIDARLSKNAAELTQTIIEHGPPVWDDGAPNVGQGMGLLQIMKPLKGNANLWLAYMAARRADRLMGENRERLFTRAEIDAALDLARTHPEFDVARAAYNQLQKQVLDFAEQAGVINAQGRALWEHADYIPFHRIIEGGEVKAHANGGGAIGSVRNQIKKLTGGQQKIGDPLENIVRNWLALMDASLKTNAARTTVDGLNGTGLVTPYKGATPSAPVVPFSAAKQFLAANPQLAQTFSAIGLNPAALTPQAFAGLQQMMASTGPVEDDVISVWRGGKREHWKVHDPLLFRSLQNIHSKAWAPIIKVLTYPKRILTKGITLTPQFAVKNFWRDIWHVFVQGARASTGDKITVLPTDSLKGLVSTLRNDATAKGLLAGGGSFTEGYVNGVDLGGAAKIVRRSINRGKIRGALLDSPMKVWRFYRDLQNAAENANRVAMYNKSRAKGRSRKESIFAARDLLDFSMRGNNPIAQLIVMSTPFMNARLQGLYRLGRALKQDFMSVALRGMLITLASAALLARNWDDERYKELTDEQKANYWHFFNVFAEGDHFQLPKPFEVGSIFGTIPEAIGDAMFTNAEDPDGTLQAAKLVGYTFGQTLNLTPQPQAVWPLLELATNKDSFTGSPILTQGDESVLPEDQRGPRTSPTYDLLAQAMPDTAPEAMRSPKQLEHLGRGYLGNLQDYVLLASDAMVRQARGEAAPPERATQDIPGIRDFYKSPGPARNTRSQTTMYELADQAAKVQASIRRNTEAETDEGDARAEKLEEENAPLLDVADDFKKAAKSVTDLKKEQRQVQLDPDMTPEEKRTEIDSIQQEINDTARDVFDLRPGGKLNPDTGASLIIATPLEREGILRRAGLPATADLLSQLA